MLKNKFFRVVKQNIYLFIILITGFVLYFKSINFGYTYHDDTILILNNLSFLSTFLNIITSFKISVFEYLRSPDNFYRPIFLISLILDTKLSTFYPNIYHFTNIIIHLLNSLFLLVFLKKIKVKKDTSFLLTLIFTIHPLFVQAVSWIPGRNDSLLFLFVLLYFVSFLNFIEKNKKRYFLQLLFWYFLAIFTKETAIVLLLLTILYKIIFLDKKNNLKIIFITVGNFIITFCWYLLRQRAIKFPVEYPFLKTMTIFVKNISGVLIYIGKFFIPTNLSTMTVIKNYPIYYGLIAIFVVLLLFLFSKKKEYGKMVFGLVFFGLFFLPTIYGSNPNNTFIFLEHRAYVPSMGILITLSEIDFIKNYSLKNKIHVFMSLILVVILLLLNFYHQENFRNRMSFWTNAVKTATSNATSHWGLGMAYYSANNLVDAEREYKEAVILNPNQQYIYNNLGVIYLDQGKLEEAKKMFEQELLLGKYSDVLYNYGLVMQRLGYRSVAKEYWLKTLDLNTDYIKALKSLYFLNKESFNIMEAEHYKKELIDRNIEF